MQLALVLGPRLPAEAMDLVAQRVARAEEVQCQAGRLAVWEVPAARHAHESRTERARVLGAAYTSTTRQAPNIQTTDGRPRAYTMRKSCQVPGHAHVGVCWPHISTTSLITQTAPMMRSVAESATREKYQAPYPSRSALQTAFHATRLSCEEPRQLVHARQSLPQTRSSEVAVGASIIGWSGPSRAVSRGRDLALRRYTVSRGRDYCPLHERCVGEATQYATITPLAMTDTDRQIVLNC